MRDIGRGRNFTVTETDDAAAFTEANLKPRLMARQATTRLTAQVSHLTRPFREQRFSERALGHGPRARLFHDPAAVLVLDGETVAAAEEGRFVTYSYDPALAVQPGADITDADWEGLRTLFAQRALPRDRARRLGRRPVGASRPPSVRAGSPASVSSPRRGSRPGRARRASS